MKGSKIIDVLKKRFGVTTSSQLSKILRLSAPRISQIDGADMVNDRALISIFKSALDAERSRTSIDLAETSFAALEKEVSGKPLHEFLGVTYHTLRNWRKQGLTYRTLRSLVMSAYEAGKQDAREDLLSPICEFVRIDPGESLSAASPQILCRKTASTYFSGLVETLAAAKGIYVFYDSSGRAIYVGKTEKGNLWAEINNAFMRERKTQEMYRVEHPTVNTSWNTGIHSKRRLSKSKVKLHDMAFYFSAYEVVPEQISQVEALLIRAFPNDVLNVKMETLERFER